MCDVELLKAGNDFKILGRFTNTLDDKKISYIAPCPPDYRTSLNGSALPYHCKAQAFENTPNSGQVLVQDDGTFEIEISKPNQYYESDDLISPYILIGYSVNGEDTLLRVDLDEVGVENRHLKRKIRSFGDENEVTTQENLIRKKSN